MGFFPRTLSFTNPSFLESPAPVTGHSYLLHTLPVFVGKRGLTCMQNVPLPSTDSSDGLSSSVCNLMRRNSIHLLPLAYGPQRSPLICPANRIWSERRPRRIRCYKMCFSGSGLWCWDKTTPAGSDDAPSQCWGWRGVLSLFFEVRTGQGRATLSQKSLRGVCAPNRK